MQLPERKHPGVVVQGDSLANLCSLAQGADEELRRGNTAEAAELLDELRTLLDGYQASYTDAVGELAVREKDA